MLLDVFVAASLPFAGQMFRPFQRHARVRVLKNCSLSSRDDRRLQLAFATTESNLLPRGSLGFRERFLRFLLFSAYGLLPRIQPPTFFPNAPKVSAANLPEHNWGQSRDRIVMAHLCKRIFHTRQIARFLEKPAILQRGNVVYQEHPARLRLSTVPCGFPCRRLFLEIFSDRRDFFRRSLNFNCDAFRGSDLCFCHLFCYSLYGTNAAYKD